MQRSDLLSSILYCTSRLIGSTAWLIWIIKLSSIGFSKCWKYIEYLIHTVRYTFSQAYNRSGMPYIYGKKNLMSLLGNSLPINIWRLANLKIFVILLFSGKRDGSFNLWWGTCCIRSTPCRNSKDLSICDYVYYDFKGTFHLVLRWCNRNTYETSLKTYFMVCHNAFTK